MQAFHARLSRQDILFDCVLLIKFIGSHSVVVTGIRWRSSIWLYTRWDRDREPIFIRSVGLGSACGFVNLRAPAEPNSGEIPQGI